jgi:hypothetical protein
VQRPYAVSGVFRASALAAAGVGRMLMSVPANRMSLTALRAVADAQPSGIHRPAVAPPAGPPRAAALPDGRRGIDAREPWRVGLARRAQFPVPPLRRRSSPMPRSTTSNTWRRIRGGSAASAAPASTARPASSRRPSPPEADGLMDSSRSFEKGDKCGNVPDDVPDDRAHRSPTASGSARDNQTARRSRPPDG